MICHPAQQSARDDVTALALARATANTNANQKETGQ